MNKRSIGIIVLILFFGTLLGTLLGELLGWILPDSVVIPFNNYIIIGGFYVK